MLEIAGVKINREGASKTSCSGIEFEFGPKVLMEPHFALTLQDIREQISGDSEVFCSAVLVLGKAESGQTPALVDKKVGGLLKRSATFGTCEEKTKTISFEAAAENDKEEIQIRGFKTVETPVEDKS